MKNTITEIKNTLEGSISRSNGAEECINELEERVVEISEDEQQQQKRIKEMRTA